MRTRILAALCITGSAGACLIWGAAASADPLPRSPSTTTALIATLHGQTQAEREVIDEIINSFKYVKENLRSDPDLVPRDGSLEFWSSGGLLHEIGSEGRTESYESFNVTPKHIRVVMHSDSVATALYYSEGSMKPGGYPAVTDYRVRVTQTMVRQDGRWVAKVSHWSPIQGGAGTSQTAKATD